MQTDPSGAPTPAFYRITCNIRVQATSRSHAQSLASEAVEAWNDETGWKHLSGILPEGYVLVSEEDSVYWSRP